MDRTRKGRFRQALLVAPVSCAIVCTIKISSFISWNLSLSTQQQAMDRNTFRQSIHHHFPQSRLSAALQALWWDAKGNWEQAHALVQDDTSRHGAWVHAYLHRKEGDEWNARYWYRLAGKSFPTVSLEEEWQRIVDTLLA